MLVKYIRGKHGRLCGVVVAEKTEGGFGLGWSAVHPKDNFNKALALRIARGRVGHTFSDEAVPRHVYPELRAMFDRATRYFK